MQPNKNLPEFSYMCPAVEASIYSNGVLASLVLCYGHITCKNQDCIKDMSLIMVKAVRS